MVYIAIDDENLKRFEFDDPMELLEEISDECKMYNIDKLFDGLHFLLTGNSVSMPIENNKLSMAIVGVYNFETNDFDFVSHIPNEILKEIINAMENINADELKNTFEPSIYRKNNIKPNIWEDDKKEELYKELIKEFIGLLSFYKEAFKKRLNIIFTPF
jgi:hypothetical protein